jgi:hypothetical protein
LAIAARELRHDVTSDGDAGYRNSSKKRSEGRFAMRAWVASAMNCSLVP